MELIEKLRKQLSEEYGIHSDQELMDAIAHLNEISEERKVSDNGLRFFEETF